MKTFIFLLLLRFFFLLYWNAIKKQFVLIRGISRTFSSPSLTLESFDTWKFSSQTLLSSTFCLLPCYVWEIDDDDVFSEGIQLSLANLMILDFMYIRHNSYSVRFYLSNTYEQWEYVDSDSSWLEQISHHHRTQRNNMLRRRIVRISESSSPNDQPFEGSNMLVFVRNGKVHYTKSYAIDNLKRGDKVISQNCSHKDVSFRLKYRENAFSPNCGWLGEQNFCCFSALTFVGWNSRFSKKKKCLNERRRRRLKKKDGDFCAQNDYWGIHLFSL